MLLRKTLILFDNKTRWFLFRSVLKNTFKVQQWFKPQVGIYRHGWNVKKQLLLKLLNLVRLRKRFYIFYFFTLASMSQGAYEFMRFFYLFTTFILFNQNNYNLFFWMDLNSNIGRHKFFLRFNTWLSEANGHSFRFSVKRLNDFNIRISKYFVFKLFKNLFIFYVLSLSSLNLNYEKFFKKTHLDERDQRSRIKKTFARMKNFPVLLLKAYDFSYVISEANLMDMLFIMEREELKHGLSIEDDEKDRPILWFYTPNSKHGEYDMGSRSDFEVFYRCLIVVYQKTEEDVFNTDVNLLTKMYIFKMFPKVRRNTYYASLSISSETQIISNVLMALNADVQKTEALNFLKSNRFFSGITFNYYYGNYEDSFFMGLRYSNKRMRKGFYFRFNLTNLSKSLFVKQIKLDPLQLFFKNKVYPKELMRYATDALYTWEVIRLRKYLLNYIFSWFGFKEVRSSNFIFLQKNARFYGFLYYLNYFRIIFFWLVKIFGWPHYHPTLFYIRMYCRVTLGNLRLILSDAVRNFNLLSFILPDQFRFTEINNYKLQDIFGNRSIWVNSYDYTLKFRYDKSLIAFFYITKKSLVIQKIFYWNYMFFFMLESTFFRGNAKNPFWLELYLFASPYMRDFFAVVRRIHYRVLVRINRNIYYWSHDYGILFILLLYVLSLTSDFSFKYNEFFFWLKSSRWVLISASKLLISRRWYLEDYEYPGSFWIGLRYGGWVEKIKQLKFLDFYLYDEYRFLRFGSNSYTIHIDFYCKDYTGNELLLSQIPELKKIDEYEWTKLSLQVLGLIK